MMNGHRGLTVRDVVGLARRLMVYGLALGVGASATAVGLAGVVFQDRLALELGVGLAVVGLVLLVGVGLWTARLRARLR